jgi:hypothetical protein
LTVALRPGTLARVNPWLGALVVVVALALSTGGGWFTTRLVLHLASRSSDAGRTTSPAVAPTERGRTAGTVETAGPVPADEPRRATTPTEPDGEPAAAAEPTAAPASDGPEGPGAVAALRGGTWIGLLERLATTGALLYGEPTAVAVVVAVKGLGRYPELREYPAASERFVVGSLASLIWAAGVGFVGRWLLTR